MRARLIDPNRLSLRTVVWSLAAMAGVILAMRVHLIAEPMERDTANYAVLAREWASGRPLYTDLWLHSPPGIVWVYGLVRAVVGDGPQEMFALGLTSAWATLLAIYVATVRIARSRLAGLWAAVFWTIFSGSLPLEFNLPSCEVVMALCAAGAIALLARQGNITSRWAAIVSAGLLLAFDSLVKQVTIPTTVAIAIVLAIWPPASTTRRRAFAEAGILLGVSLVVWLGLLVCLYAHGTLSAFWETNVAFNVAYSRGSGSSGMLANLLESIKAPTRLERPFFDLRWVLFLLVTSTGLASSKGSTASRHAKALLIGSAIGAYLAIALPGNFFEHYFQLAVPNICIALGVMSTAAWPRTIPFQRGVTSLVLATLAIVLLILNDRYYAAPAERWPQLEFLNDRDNDIESMSSVAARLLRPNEMLFDWGDDPQLYLYTGSRSPTGILFSATVLLNPKYQGPWSARQHEQALADLERTEPELVVMYDVDDPSAGDPIVGAWIKANYRKRPERIGIVALYENVHGRIARERFATH